MKATFLHLCVLFGGISATEKIRYDGYKLFKVFVPHDTGLESLENIQDDDGYHFWLRPKINESANVMISPGKVEEFMQITNTSKLEPELMMEDVQKYIDDENPRANLRGTFDWNGYYRLNVKYIDDEDPRANLRGTFDWNGYYRLNVKYIDDEDPRANLRGTFDWNGYYRLNVKYIDDEDPRANLRGTFDWNGYYRLNVIYQWLDSLVAQYPKIVRPITGGSSYEGRSIRGVKLSYREGNPGIFIEGGIHAREWISPAVVTYILNELILSDDTRVRYMAESYDWYIFPVFNPDGYEYTHTTNRLWRKTRRPYGRGCYGADPNRNWDFHWAEGGTSPNPCSEIYPGPRPFSEPETRTMSRYIDTVQDKIFAYVAFHSYSQLLLIPYGHSNKRVENYDDLYQIGNYSVQTLAKRYGTRYKVGNIVDVIYVATGGSMDWVRGTHKIPITFTYELRDRGRYGFVLPANQIVPTAEETMDSLVAMFQKAATLGYGSPAANKR